MFRGLDSRPLWITAINTGAVTVPSMAVVEMVGGMVSSGTTGTLNAASDIGYVNVRRPTSANCTQIAVNSVQPILAGQAGLVAVTGPVHVNGGAIFNPGTFLGTQADSFVLAAGEGLYSLGKGVGNVVVMEFARTALFTMKQLARFTLDSAMATTDASKAATLTDFYGQGQLHATTSVTVYNLRNGANTAYVFSGATNAAGYAYWDSGTSWRIIQMECP